MSSAKHSKGEPPEAVGPEATTSSKAAAQAPPADMAQLQQQLEEKTREAQENYDRTLRLAAEMENLKKRLEREKADLLQFANENLIKELLPVVDNLELALEHGRQTETPAPFLEGIELVHQGFLKALARFGVTPLVVLGQPFDPAFHNAVMQETSPEVFKAIEPLVNRQTSADWWISNKDKGLEVVCTQLLTGKRPQSAAGPRKQGKPGGSD